MRGAWGAGALDRLRAACAESNRGIGARAHRIFETVQEEAPALVMINGIALKKTPVTDAH